METGNRVCWVESYLTADRIVKHRMAWGTVLSFHDKRMEDVAAVVDAAYIRVEAVGVNDPVFVVPHRVLMVQGW